MNNITNFFRELDSRTKIIIGALVGVVVMLLSLTTLKSSNNYELLYSNLNQSAINDITLELDKINIPYSINNNAISVERNEKNKARIHLAQLGLPKRNQEGYELLDNMPTIGTTSDMFDANLWRAKEGELARTISAMENISEARVHIAPEAKSAFQRKNVKPSASVTITTKFGSSVNKKQANAIRYVVALAVRGLDPKDVTVIDTATGVLLSPGNSDLVDNSNSSAMEQESKLKSEIVNILEPFIGYNKVKVTVAVEPNLEEENIVSKTVDPNGKVTVSTENVEINDENSNGGAYPVTVTQNIGEGADTEGGAAASPNKRTESQERVNYEVSEVKSNKVIYAGSIKRISVGVVVDGKYDEAKKWSPRSTEEINQISDLIKSAIGFNSERGDTVIVQSLEFKEFTDSLGTSSTEKDSSLYNLLSKYIFSIIQLLVVVLIAALLFFFVLRPLLLQGNPSAQSISAMQPTNLSLTEDVKITPMGVVGDVESQLSDPFDESVGDSLIIQKVKDIINSNPKNASNVINKWLTTTGNSTNGDKNDDSSLSL